MANGAPDLAGEVWSSTGRVCGVDAPISGGLGLSKEATCKYEISMKPVAKVAVSLPVDTLRSLERVRARLRKTRSRAVTEAVERWLQAEEVSDEERRYLEGYLRHPDGAAETAATAGAVVATWEPWE